VEIKFKYFEKGLGGIDKLLARLHACLKVGSATIKEMSST
jgi:hypothetical protein